ncbi:unnamed protein product [Caenorhabditis nigoni]
MIAANSGVFLFAGKDVDESFTSQSVSSCLMGISSGILERCPIRTTYEMAGCQYTPFLCTTFEPVSSLLSFYQFHRLSLHAREW